MEDRVSKIMQYCVDNGWGFEYERDQFEPGGRIGRRCCLVKIYTIRIGEKLFRLSVKQSGDLKYALEEDGEIIVLSFSQSVMLDHLKSGIDSYGRKFY